MQMKTTTHIAIPIDLADRLVTYLSDRSAVAERLLQAIQSEGVPVAIASDLRHTSESEEVDE